jgi:hypothetical protein
MANNLVQEVPKIIEASSKNAYGVAVFAILCIAVIAYILLKKSIKTKDKFVYSFLCLSAVVIVALVFVKIPPSTNPALVAPPPPAESNTTSGAQSPIQVNKDGDNNYSPQN